MKKMFLLLVVAMFYLISVKSQNGYHNFDQSHISVDGFDGNKSLKKDKQIEVWETFPNGIQMCLETFKAYKGETKKSFIERFSRRDFRRPNNLGFDTLLLSKYPVLDLDDPSRMCVFFNAGIKYAPMYHPSNKEIWFLWEKSKVLNPWIKDLRKIPIGTPILWNADGCKNYSGNFITFLKKGENPWSQSEKIQESPFFYE